MKRFDLKNTKTIVETFEASHFTEAVIFAEFDLKMGNLDCAFSKADADICDVNVNSLIDESFGLTVDASPVSPGPWQIDVGYIDGCDHIAVCCNPNNSEIVAVLGRVGAVDEAVSLANANLICASKDLLRAAKIALQLVKDHWPEEHGQRDVGVAWGSLEDVIKKAEGVAKISSCVI
ncbi:hypothetical protein [Rhodoferax antarcticus]|uniref:Uncharacterized protein n=1 Tax=Rhodoferax antarcticus ANT.BR TaxID=1111071 RepID=A0A1Q8Y9C2_9BURK|nr:hypothetical protein [Rhodoferax antarcticus]OLP04631.1 hypothetical protein BLL52_4104 [Rhodoferax antarcticus ANT.BR]